MAHIGKVITQLTYKLITDSKWRRRKKAYYYLYVQFSLKYLLFWKFLHIPLHHEKINEYNIQFFHYSIFLSLFEDMFLNDEYYVKLPKSPHIIDLGSEVGISTIYFKLMYPNASVDAFEPDPASYTLLKDNIYRNSIKFVETHNVALANNQGHLPFYVDSKVDGSLTMSLFPARQQKKIEVKVDKLSKYITQKVDLIKIDIEGAELSVIQDLVDSKKIKFIQNIIVEYHHHINKKQNNLADFIHLLESAGVGYQIKAKLNTPFEKNIYQDFLIYTYRT